jgi:hypothetical protein
LVNFADDMTILNMLSVNKKFSDNVDLSEALNDDSFNIVKYLLAKERIDVNDAFLSAVVGQHLRYNQAQIISTKPFNTPRTKKSKI